MGGEDSTAHTDVVLLQVLAMSDSPPGEANGTQDFIWLQKSQLLSIQFIANILSNLIFRGSDFISATYVIQS